MEPHLTVEQDIQPAVTLVHDITSLPSWLAILRIGSLPPALRAKVGFRGFEHVGVDMPVKTNIETKAIFLTMKPEFQRYGRNVGFPKVLVPTYKAHAVINWAWHGGFGWEMMTAMYEAFWGCGQDINSDSVLVEIASSVLSRLNSKREAVTPSPRVIDSKGEQIVPPQVGPSSVEALGLHASDWDIQAVEDLLQDRFSLNEFRRELVQARALHIGGVPVLQVAGTLQPAVISEDAYRDLLSMF